MRIIEFAGLPSAGKTTLCHAIADRLKDEGKSVTVVNEFAKDVIKSYRPITKLNSKKENWIFNVWTTSHIISKIIEEVARERDHILIFDRGLFDSICWFHWFLNKRMMTKKQFQMMVHFVTTEDWYDKIETVVFLECSFNTALKRRNMEVGRIVNKANFSKLNTSFRAIRSDRKQYFDKQFIRINTDKLEVKEVEEKIWSKIKLKYI